jgi:glutamate-1-semialdehyde 2,1-aminomutase
LKQHTTTGPGCEIFRTKTKIRLPAIIEPILNISIVPQEGFLEYIENLDANGALFVFDEVMTGFRLAAGGAQETTE